MMVIAILRLAPEQKIARPHNRASSPSEAFEILRFAGIAASAINLDNIDTEQPVGVVGAFKYFAFTER